MYIRIGDLRGLTAAYGLTLVRPGWLLSRSVPPGFPELSRICVARFSNDQSHSFYFGVVFTAATDSAVIAFCALWECLTEPCPPFWNLAWTVTKAFLSQFYPFFPIYDIRRGKANCRWWTTVVWRERMIKPWHRSVTNILALGTDWCYPKIDTSLSIIKEDSIFRRHPYATTSLCNCSSISCCPDTTACFASHPTSARLEPKTPLFCLRIKYCAPWSFVWRTICWTRSRW